MADDMDSETCVGFERTIKEIQETQTLPQCSDSPSEIPQRSDSPSSEMVVSPLKQDPEIIQKSSPCSLSESSKKAKPSPNGQPSETHLHKLQEIPNSLSAKAKASDFVSGFFPSDGVSQDFMESCQVGFASDVELVKNETQQTLDDGKERVFSDLADKKGDKVNEFELGFASDVELANNETEQTLDDGKERVFSDLADKKGKKVAKFEVGFAEFDCKEGLDGSKVEFQSLLELKKQQLLEEVEAFLVPAEKTNVKSGAADVPVSSFKIEVIDDTALIETVKLPKPGNGCGNDLGFAGPPKCAAQRNGNKNAKQDKNGKKAIRPSGRKEKVMNHVVEARSESSKNEKGAKIVYSRMELEAMRFGNVAEQKALWRDIYRGLGPVVATEYDNLASAKHQKNINNNFEPRKRFQKMEVGPGILGEAFSKSVDIESENVASNETHDARPLDPFCSYSASGEDGYSFPEKECSQDDDSDEDYASIQRPAFVVEGEPDFDSGSPEDGLEYLRRVRWEAAQIPKVRVAKLDRSKFNREQSAYMPKIPEIAKCPDQLLPLKQWEDAFLAEFSELRLALSRFEGSNVSTPQDPQSKTILHEKCYSHQQPGLIVFEKVSNVKSKETDIHLPHDCSVLGSSADQPSLSTTEGSNAALPAENFRPESFSSRISKEPPLLSVILQMDSVAQVAMLRKRINAVEDSSSLSRNDCVWLFALCAVVDTPLHADTSASLRSLLRKCAALRAAKSTLDDEVVMLNILATISGRYFGQSEN